MSQRVLGTALGYAMPVNSVRAVERGRAFVPTARLWSLRQVLQISLDELLREGE